MATRPIDFADQLHSAGYRLTPQRQLIMDAMRKAAGHVTPDQIYTQVHARNPAISRATIYRTLDFLCEMRQVVALEWGGQTYYEIAGELPHHHLICRNCNQVEPLDHTLLEMVIDTIWKKHRFKVDMDHVILFGLCAECGAGKSKRSQRSAR